MRRRNAEAEPISASLPSLIDAKEGFQQRLEMLFVDAGAPIDDVYNVTTVVELVYALSGAGELQRVLEQSVDGFG